MVHPPAISVLMAVYNGQAYLRQSVTSVLKQSFGDFEFLILDDGSTDSSKKILEEFAARDLRIRLISRPNKGLTKTLNEGLSLCTAEFVARMDGDDICLPNRFEKQLAFLKEHPEVNLVGSQVEFIDPDGAKINPKPGLMLTHEEIDATLLKKGWPIVHPAVMMRRSAMLEIGGYSERWQTNQDHDLFLRMAEHGRLANLPDLLLQYRQHFSSVTLAKAQQQGDAVEQIVREAYLRRGMAEPNGLLAARPKIKSRLDHHRNWCWAALSAGNIATARKHARATLWAKPFSAESWRMMYCSLRGK